MYIFTQKSFKFTLLFFSFLCSFAVAEAQVNLLVSTKATSNGNTVIDSIKTGAPFIFVINYSVSSLTTNGNNVQITVPLPTNLTVVTGATSIAYDPSQVATVTNSNGLITAKLISPIPAGSTGQMQISLQYTNGSTPNGYKPPIIANITGTNANVSPKSDTSYVKALATNSIALTKTAQSFGTAPTVNGPYTYKLTYNNTGGATGNLDLYNAKIADTIPANVEFVSATNFGSIVPTVTTIAGGATVVSWNWGNTTFSGTASANITVKYKSPAYSVGSTVSNCASLTGNIPVLPFVASNPSLAAAPEIRGCYTGTLIASTNGVSNSGTGISSNIPGLCPGTVMAGGPANFKAGWTNSGNTNLDFVQVITTIDPNIDVTAVYAKKVTNPIPGSSSPRLKVYLYYELNTAPGTYVAVAGSPFDNATMSNSYPVTLSAGQYITKTKVRVEPGLDPITPYLTQDLTYTGTIRTAVQGPHGSGTIIQGSNNPGTCTVNVAGTNVKNCYTLSAQANLVNPLTSNPTCGTTSIIGQAPVFSSLNKATTNGSSFGPAQQVDFELSANQLGIGTATNVSLVDSLDNKLTYIPNSAQFKVGSGGTYAAIAPANVSVVGPIVTFKVPDVVTNSQIFVKFSTMIKDGTAPTTIANKAKLVSNNSIINAGNPFTNTKTITVISAAAYTSKLGQNGCDTTRFVYYPENAEATPQGKIKYRALLRNTGNVGANNITMIDVFPFIGDTRGSQYFANLAAPISFNDPQTVIYYDTVSNPCMPEFTPAVNNPGCKVANWSTTPPADITSVKAVKFVRSATIAPLDSLVYTWPMILPVGVPTNITMYNSYTYQLNRTDNGAQLLPATPNKVGMVTSCVSALGSLGNYVWVDSNANGLQDEAIAAGLNGLKVYLYKKGPSNVLGGSDQILLDSTFTANNFNNKPGYYTFTNLNTGDYYVKFPTLPGKVFTKKDQTVKTDNNSNADRATGYSELVRINVAQGGLDKDNPTIDAGYIVCTLNAVAVKSDITCKDWNDGKVTVNVTGSRGSSTFAWNDGFTTKDRSFLVAGTYTVQVTDSVGCTKSSSITIVNPSVIAPIAGKQALCVDSTTQLTHPTAGGVWSSNNTSAVTVSNTGLLTAVAPGSATISYKLNNYSCGTVYFYSFVNNCGPGGGVSGGGGGGLESKSLGDAVANRLFNKAVNSLQGPVDYSTLKTPSFNQIRSNGVGVSLTLPELLPQSLASASYKASVTTPTDIVSITNAKDVLSIDFSIDNKAKAVAFATKTTSEVYSHTKSICDRLKGSELIGIQNVNVNNVNMIRYDLKTTSGVIEYAMSFVVGSQSGRNSYTIQSNWLNKDYLTDEVMYNVQLWAVNTGLLMDMATDVINKLQASMPVNVIDSKVGLPKTYVTIGKREGTNLSLTINNSLPGTSGYFEVTEKANEKAGYNPKRTVPFTINANGQSKVNLAVNDNYEASIDLYLSGTMQDQVFMADGTWGYDYNTNTSIIKSFVTSNDPTIVNANKEDYLLFRNVKMEATTPDAVSVYKMLRGGGVAEDLTGYKTFQFNAKGAGTNLRITLVKDGIQNWADQYNYVVALSGDEKLYQIGLNDFKSAATKDKLVPSDITSVVFSFEVAGGRNINLSSSLANVSFTKEDIAYNNSLLSKKVKIYPNPSTGKFNASFKADSSKVVTVKVVNTSNGATILSRTVNAIKGENIVPIDIKDLVNGGIYILSIDGADAKYEPQKVIITKN